jgi:hypothetical protein
MRRWGRIALWILALLPSVILAVLSALFWFLMMTAAAGPTLDHGWEILIPAGTLLVSTVGTISTIWLAWRKERRDSREYTLKIQQLEMQLSELQKSAGVKKADWSAFGPNLFTRDTVAEATAKLMGDAAPEAAVVPLRPWRHSIKPLAPQAACDLRCSA